MLKTPAQASCTWGQEAKRKGGGGHALCVRATSRAISWSLLILWLTREAKRCDREGTSCACSFTTSRELAILVYTMLACSFLFQAGCARLFIFYNFKLQAEN
jgi:hypothetical protein